MSLMIVGILTVEGSGGISGNKANFRDLVRIGKKLMIPVFVVPVEGIQLPQNKCLGYRWNKGWNKTSIPLPNVFYNRISTRRAEKRPDVIQIKKLLAKAGIPLFNPGFFKKDELYEIVGASPDIKEMLPKTLSFNRTQLRDMLNEFGKVYVKPVQSKAGKGIIRIDQAGNKLLIQSQVDGKRITRVMKFDEIYIKLARDRKFDAYVLQRGITLANHEGHPYDLRVLVQKDSTGNWDVTGIGARVAPLGGILTHVPNGGVIRGAEEVLQASFKDEANDLLKGIKRKVLEIAQTIEQNSQGIIGEMSVDIGVDESGKPWFFEANAKPMKFDEPDIRALSLRRTLEYCRFLNAKNGNGAD